MGMKLAVQTGGMEGILGIDGTYRLIAETGFDGADANIDHVVRYPQVLDRDIPKEMLGSEGDFLELFRPWRDASLKYGIPNSQAHAPFPSMVWCPEDEAYNQVLLDVIRKSIIGCDYAGSRKLVIHPFFYPYDHQMKKEDKIQENLKRYSYLGKTAKEYGITICLENLITFTKGKIYSACCSDARELCLLVDELNRLAGTEIFGACLDTGHALTLGQEVGTFMELLGKRIKVFHIHDNNGILDQHLAPYMGIQDWSRFIQGLRDIHFADTISFETCNVWKKIPPELGPDFMRFLEKTGRYFIAEAEKLSASCPSEERQ